MAIVFPKDSSDGSTSNNLPELVSPRNDSYQSRQCLTWPKQPSSGADKHRTQAAVDVRQRRNKELPKMVAMAPPAVPFPREPDLVDEYDYDSPGFGKAKKRRNDEFSETRKRVFQNKVKDHYGVIAGYESGPDNLGAGVKKLDTIRRQLGDEKFLADKAEEKLRRHKKDTTGMWEWQSRTFNVHHQAPTDVRSNLQILEDAKREKDRKTHRQFKGHLRHIAMYKSVNRIPIRSATTHREEEYKQMKAERKALQKAEEERYAKEHFAPPTADMGGNLYHHYHQSEEHTPAYCGSYEEQRGQKESESARRPMSSRVRHKIAELVAKFNPPMVPKGGERGHHDDGNNNKNTAAHQTQVPRPPNSARPKRSVKIAV